MPHQKQDDIGLALARRIAGALRQHPEWIARAKANLERWSKQNADAPALLACYREWRSILERPVEDVAVALVDPTDRGPRLRQNSPFAGALPPAEVWRMKRQAHETTST
jgi:hypothetical protein